MKILKNIGMTLAIFAICQLALFAMLSVYPSQCLPMQTEILQAIAFAKGSGNLFLAFSLTGYICVVAPLSEEVIFRLSLGDIRYLPTSLLCFFAVVSASYIFPFELRQSHTIWLRSLWILLITLVLVQSLHEKFHLQAWQKFWQHRIILSVLFSFVFALLHLQMERISGATSFLLLLSPYFFLGLVISFVRVKLGFGYGLFYHFLNNLLAMAIAYSII